MSFFLAAMCLAVLVGTLRSLWLRGDRTRTRADDARVVPLACSEPCRGGDRRAA